MPAQLVRRNLMAAAFPHILNFAIQLFKTCYVFGKRFHKTFCMLWSKNYSRLHFAFRCSWHYVYEINYKFCVRMSDDGKIGVITFCNIFRRFRYLIDWVLVDFDRS